MRQYDEQPTTTGEADQEEVVRAPKIKPTTLPGIAPATETAQPFGGVGAEAIPMDELTRSPGLPAPTGPDTSLAPMPPVTPASTFSFNDPVTGQPTQGDLPPGVPGYASAPLVADKNGAFTSTPEGDASNAFRGYVSPDGGKFGGFAADKGADAASWGGVANRDPASLQKALGSSDPALQQAAAKELAKSINDGDTSKLQGLSPQQLEMVKSAFLDKGGLYAADQAGFDPNRASQQGLYQSKWDQTASALANPDRVTPDAPVAAAPPRDYRAEMAAAEKATIGTGGGEFDPATGKFTAMAPTAAEQALERASQFRDLNSDGRQVPLAPPVANPPAYPTSGGMTAPTSATEGFTATPGKVANVPAQLPSVAPAPDRSGYTNVSKTATTPDNSLIGQTLDYGPLADRFKIAQDELSNWNTSTEPMFQANLRDAMRKAAAGGALGSGMLQTSLGDIAYNRELQRQGMGNTFLNNALTGTIGDAKDRANFAAGQQGFQQGQQQTAFNQGVTEAELNDRLTGNAFQRYLQTLTAGNSGNPADIQLALSGIYGGAGNDASSALAQYLQGATANGGNNTNDILRQLLAAISGGQSTAPQSYNVPNYTVPTSLPTGINLGGTTGPTSPFAVGYRP